MEPVEGDSYYIFTNDKKMIGVNVPDDISISDLNLLDKVISSPKCGNKEFLLIQYVDREKAAKDKR